MCLLAAVCTVSVRGFRLSLVSKNFELTSYIRLISHSFLIRFTSFLVVFQPTVYLHVRVFLSSGTVLFRYVDNKTMYIRIS